MVETQIVNPFLAQVKKLRHKEKSQTYPDVRQLLTQRDRKVTISFLHAPLCLSAPETALITWI